VFIATGRWFSVSPQQTFYVLGTIPMLSGYGWAIFIVFWVFIPEKAR
jgi:hypothetical protein